MKKIIILNFEIGEVHVFNFDENIWESAEDFFTSEECEEFDLREEHCHYMVVDELNIQIH